MIDASGYDVWYNVATAPFRLNWLGLAVAIFIVIGLVSAGLRSQSRLLKVLCPTGAAFVLVLSAWGIWRDTGEHRLLQDALRRGEFTIVEGPVSDFNGGRRHCDEINFRVEGRHFDFSSCEIVSGFNGSGARDLTGACVKIALVHVPTLNADRAAWFGVRECL